MAQTVAQTVAQAWYRRGQAGHRQGTGRVQAGYRQGTGRVQAGYRQGTGRVQAGYRQEGRAAFDAALVPTL